MSKKLLHTPEGVRDIYGNEYAGKLAVQQSLYHTISGYGFEDIQTPSFEYFDVFSKEVGTTPSKELYKFVDKEGNTLVLRPDFTPSIARCAAKYYMEDETPIRFCYLGNTFTNTHNLQGKLKEVTQMGAELINDDSVYADAEMIALVIESLNNAGLRHYQLCVGHVDFFKGICEEAGLDADTENELRDYISGKNYFAADSLLQEKQVPVTLKNALLTAADLFGGIDSLMEAKKAVTNQRSLSAIARLEAIYEVLKLYGVEQYISFDLGMLSKYHYYTGIIFKVFTYGVGAPIVKGGRYNNLLSQFGKNAAAIGFAMVIDDVMEALKRQDAFSYHPAEKTVITYTSDTYADKLVEAKKLRAQGVPTLLIPERQV